MSTQFNSLLQTIKEKFPGQSEHIDELYNNNKTFREACLNYFSCLQNLKKCTEKADKIEAVFIAYENRRLKQNEQLLNSIMQKDSNLSGS